MTPQGEQGIVKALERIADALEKLCAQPQETANIVQELYASRKTMERMFSSMAAGSSPAEALHTPDGPRSVEEEIPAAPPETIAAARARDLDAVLAVNAALAAGALRMGPSGLVEVAR